MMNLTTLLKSFWGYALETTARILNMLPTKKVDRTPYEIWHGKAPKLSYLRVWGCEALVKRDTPDKLDSKSIKCIFVGYPKEMMGYYFYYPLENKIFVSRNTEFFENSFMVQEAGGSHGLLEMSGSDKGLEIIQEKDTQPSENTSKEHNEVAPIKLFKKKTGMDDNVRPFKACLVAKDFTQTYGLDYGETFSPGAYIRAIRILLAITTFYGYEIWQIDVKTTFLNGRLSEDVYMVQLESGSNVAFLDLYVDDILVMGNSVTMLKEVKSWLYMVLMYGAKPEDELKVSCYADASFQTDKVDTKSQTRYVFVHNGGDVDRKNAKQSTTAMSSTKAEYIVVAEASMEAV
nr:retrotransposon protein, putative, Ty1-copia subclass [Tanacetum cinerariifolium]